MRASSDVHNFLVEQGVAHEIVQLPAATGTAQQAADLLGVGLDEIVKSLLFLLDEHPTMVLVSGDRSADVSRLKAVTGCARASLAPAGRVLEVTGYHVGAVPPFGLATSVPVVADESVFSPAIVYCGGGTLTTMLKIRSADLRRLVGAQAVTISAAPAEG